jgi:hypothetical protein
VHIRPPVNSVLKDMLENGDSKLPEKQTTVLGLTEISHGIGGKT